jgi:hypothetical protein
MTGFELGHSMAGCPQSWQNFIQAINPRPGRDVAMAHLQRELKKYGARYHIGNHHQNDYIYFESQQHLTWFLLRWT